MSPPPAASSAQERYERERFRVEPGRCLIFLLLGGHGDEDSGDGDNVDRDGDDVNVLGGHGDRDSGDGDGVDGKLAEPIKEVLANFEVAESKITPLVADYNYIIYNT